MSCQVRQKLILMVFLIAIGITLSACSANSNIRLCNYKNIHIPEEIQEVSSADVNFSIKMQMMEHNVVLPKASNGNVAQIEEGDIVNLDLTTSRGNAQNYIIVIGEESLGIEFDNLLLGKEQGSAFTCTINNSECSVQVNEILAYAEILTDEIARQYFTCNSAQEAIANTTEDIRKHRVFEYMYRFLITESMIRDYYEERDAYTQGVMQKLIAEAIDYGYETPDELEHFFEEAYNATLSEYQTKLELFFDEYLILSEFMRKENVAISDGEFDSYIAEHFQSSDEEDANSSLEIYGREFVLYSIYYEKCYNILLQYSALF